MSDNKENRIEQNRLDSYTDVLRIEDRAKAYCEGVGLKVDEVSVYMSKDFKYKVNISIKKNDI